MIFASIIPSFGEQVGFIILFLAAIFLLVGKFLKANPEVKDTLKKESAAKAMSLIAKLFKR